MGTAARLLNAAVATMERSMLAVKTQTRSRIKSANLRVTGYANQIKKEAVEVQAAMKAQVAALRGKITTMRGKSAKAIAAANEASAAGFSKVNNKIATLMEQARKKSAKRFS